MIRLLSLFTGLALLLSAGVAGAAGLEFQNYDEGVKKAAEEKKMVMLFFWADWCRYCTKIRKDVFESEKVKTEFEKNFVAVSVDIQTDKSDLGKKYRATALPTLTFIRPDGDPLAYWEGAADAETFLKILDYVLKEAGS